MSSEEEDRRVEEEEEEEEEEDEEEENLSKRKKEARKRRRQGQDDEASEDDDEDEEEEDEDAPNEYEKDDFLVDEVEEEEGEEEDGENEEERKERRRRRKREELELDDDDYDLIQEANPDFRPPVKKKGPEFKRLKKARGEEGDAEDGHVARRARTQQELQEELFGDDEDAEEPVEDDRRQDVEEEEDFSENEMDGFIVDDEFDENGNLVPRRKVKKNKGAERRGVVASSAALQEAQDIFGGVDELLNEYKNREREGEDDMEEGFDDLHVDEDELDEDGRPRRRRPSKAAKAMRAAQRAYEPSLLEERFMTDRDERIRTTDIPERFQVLEEQLGAMPERGDVVKEAGWIYQNLFNIKYVTMRDNWFELYDPALKNDIEAEIRDVLMLIHEEKLEVPYIGMYRKEKCRHLLDGVKPPPKPAGAPDGHDSEAQSKLQKFDVLWAIFEADGKWMALEQRKHKLKNAYGNLIEPFFDSGGEARIHWTGVLQEIDDLLNDATSDHAIDDVEARVRLMLPQEDQSTAKHKRPERQTLYSYCKKAGLGEIAAKFGLAKQLGATLQKDYQEADIEDWDEAPSELAASFLSAAFDGPDAVLKGARHVASVEIGSDPGVRAFVREKYMPLNPADESRESARPRGAVVSTKPTPRGLDVIDDYHRFGEVKWLRSKPVKEFKNGQWLLVTKAVEEGLLEVQLGLPEKEKEDLVTHITSMYESQNLSKVANEWNEQRKQVVRDAFEKFLVPAMEAEIRSVLAQRARRYIVGECEAALWKLAARAPYVRKIEGLEDNDEDEHACRVLSVCWGPGRPATTVAMLDDRGDLIDTLYTGFLGSKGLGGPQAKSRWEEDRRKLEEFIKEHKPHVAVIGGANLRCKNLFEDVNEVVADIVETNIDAIAPGIDTVHCTYADESIPLLYEKSKVSETELSGQSEMVRRAVALGRGLQNPLAALSALCGPGREVGLLRLHRLQGLVSKDEVWEAVERVMTTVTTQVGIDVNTAIHHEWLFSPLQFVPGLGPRKAQALQQALTGRGRLTVRKDLLNYKLLSKKVFINAAGSLRTRATAAAAHAEDMDPLDDTRIHPLQYSVAIDLCKAAWLAEQNETEDSANPDDLEMAVQEVAERPELISKVNLERFAREREAEFGDLRPALALIKAELLDPYAEWRFPYEAPDTHELFSMLTGETDDTLQNGQIVQVTVRRKLKDKVICALESGLTAFVNFNELSDHEREAADVMEQLAEGQVLTACVTNIDKGSFKVDLSCRGSYLRREKHYQRPNFGPYFEVDQDWIDEQDRAKKKKEARRQYRPRMIQHPLFKNCNQAEAITFLSEREIGDVIIRPSSRGPTHLSMTIKLFKEIYAQLEIEEEGKDKSDPTSFLKLGSKLRIGDEVFEDLDEVMARYIDPFVDYLHKFIGYRKFKDGTKLEVDELLSREKAQNPQRVAYALSISEQHAGALMLSYIRNQNPHHEYIALTHKGYRFRKQMFTSPDRLVQYFQKHINDPVIQEPVPPRRAPASVVPLPQQRPQQGYAPKSGGWDQGPAQPPPQDYHNGHHREWAPAPPSQPYQGGHQWGSGWSQEPPPAPPPSAAAPPPPPGGPPPQTAEWGGRGEWAAGNGYPAQQGYAQYQGH